MGRPAKPYGTPSNVYLPDQMSPATQEAVFQAQLTRAQRDADRAARKSPTGIGAAPPSVDGEGGGAGGGAGDGGTGEAGTGGGSAPPVLPTTAAPPQLG